MLWPCLPVRTIASAWLASTRAVLRPYYFGHLLSSLVSDLRLLGDATVTRAATSCRENIVWSLQLPLLTLEVRTRMWYDCTRHKTYTTIVGMRQSCNSVNVFTKSCKRLQNPASYLLPFFVEASSPIWSITEERLVKISESTLNKCIITCCIWFLKRSHRRPTKRYHD